MEISVIIATFQGKHKLPVILKALELQDTQNFQVVVVIDGSTDGTYDWLKNNKIPFSNFKIVIQQNKGRAASRNAGASASDGDLLIFYDDDMEPNANSVSNHAKRHENEQVVVGGNQVEYYDKKKTDIQNYKANLSSKWLRPYREGLNIITKNNLFLTAANFSIKKDLFLEFGGFDERLSDAEDHDLAHRILDSNQKIYFDTLNIAVHHDYITMTSYIKRIRQYREANLKLKILHPQRYLLTKPPKSFKRIFYRPFAISLWPTLVDSRLNIFMVFPKVIRYKIYNLIIQALGIEYPEVKL